MPPLIAEELLPRDEVTDAGRPWEGESRAEMFLEVEGLEGRSDLVGLTDRSEVAGLAVNGLPEI